MASRVYNLYINIIKRIRIKGDKGYSATIKYYKLKKLSVFNRDSIISSIIRIFISQNTELVADISINFLNSG